MAFINSLTSDSRNSFATISALSAARTSPPQTAIASSAAASSRSASACYSGAVFCDMIGPELAGGARDDVLFLF
jgi:hypothetical protein